MLRRRDIAPKADDAPYEGYIVLRRVACQHQSPNFRAMNPPPDSPLISTAWPGRGRRATVPGKVFSMEASARKRENPDRSAGTGDRIGKHVPRAGTRRTAATFHGRSLRSGGRCQFGGICARVTEFRGSSASTRNRLKQLALRRSANGDRLRRLQQRTAPVR